MHCDIEYNVPSTTNKMLQHNSTKLKSHCLKVYTFVAEAGEDAQNEIEIINEETQFDRILYRYFTTVTFTNKIIRQLEEFTKDLATDIHDIKESKETKFKPNKKELSPKRNKFSLKKEKDEEHTQDEFLEIYKIDMTEDVGVTFPTKRNESSPATNDLNGEPTKDKADDSDSSVSTIGLCEDNAVAGENLNEIDILNNIGSDSTEILSDSGDSLFSCATLLLDDLSNELTDLKESDEAVIVDKNIFKDDNKKACDTEKPTVIIKECSVVLSDCEKGKSNREYSKDSEMRAIQNLINLDNLNRKRKSEVTSDSRKPKKQKTNKNSERCSGSSSGQSSDSNKTDDDSNSLLENYNKEIEDNLTRKIKISKNGTDIMNLLLECISDISDLVEDDDADGNSSSDSYRSKNQKKSTEPKIVSKDKQNNVNEENEISEDLIETSSFYEEMQMKKRWRYDKLLTEKFTDGSTEDEKENNPVQRRTRRLRKVRKKREKQANLYKPVSTSETDHHSDSDFDNLSTENLCFSSDSSTDIEFTTIKNETADHTPTGRRNIRTVQSDALLTETTKKAQRQEEERRERLLSQTQLLSQVTEDEGLVLDVDKVTKKPVIVVNPNITHYLKVHQKEGVRFMWNSCYESVQAIKRSPGSGCILAHCMGLGKSFQVIALILTLLSHKVTNTKHIIIVCPLSTVLNWENEFKICAKIVNNVRINRYLIIDGKSKKERYKIIMDWHRNEGVLILGYDTFYSLLKPSKNSKPNSIPKKVVEALLDPGPDLVVCDEGHLIKNGTLNRVKALAKIRTKRRIVLTGTPMQNNLTEYFYMVDFVKPNLLGTKTEFCNRFTNPIVNGGYDNSTDVDIQVMRKRSHVLHEYLKDTIQRYEMSELQQYLPEKLDFVLFIPLSPLQINLYKACLEFVSASGIERKKCLLSDYMKLRDIWTHPCILRLKEKNKASQNNRRTEVDTIPVEPEIQEDTHNDWWHSIRSEDFLTNIEYGTKIKVMLEIIEQSARLNDKVLIFGSHLAELDAIEYFLKENGWRKNISYLRMDGTVPPNMRMDLCHKFNNPKMNQLKLFVLSHQVGGLGLNLVAANRIILMDVNFNPSHDSQSIFRIYRFGQHKPCYVYRLVSLGTMEEVIYERSVTKLSVSLRVVDEHQISRHYKSNDLQEMYRFNIYTDKERPVVKLPNDEVLATILEKCKKEIFKYHEHQNLLENRPEEQLNEEEQKLAWDEFRKEQEATYQNQVAANNAKLQNAQSLAVNLHSTPGPVTEVSATTSDWVSPKIVFISDLRRRSQKVPNQNNTTSTTRTPTVPKMPNMTPALALRFPVGVRSMRPELSRDVSFPNPVNLLQCSGSRLNPVIPPNVSNVANVKATVSSVIPGADMENCGRSRLVPITKHVPAIQQAKFHHPIKNFSPQLLRRTLSQSSTRPPVPNTNSLSEISVSNRPSSSDVIIDLDNVSSKGEQDVDKGNTVIELD